jgi:hypothetical protein
MLLASSPAAHAVLLANYDFDDWATPAVATDSSGLGNDAAITLASYTADAGGFTGSAGDRAISFDAAGEVINAPPGALQSMSTNNSGTISLWIYGDAAQQPRSDTIFSMTNGSARQFMSHLPWGNGNIYFDTGGCCGSNTRINGWTAPENYRGRWNHYVYIKVGNDKYVWQNGSLFRSQIGGATAPINAFNEAVIGAERASSFNNYRGLVDDFGIWDTGLSPAEARSLYTVPTSLGRDYGIGDLSSLWAIHAAGASGFVEGTYWTFTDRLPGAPSDGDAYTMGEWDYLALGNGTGLTTAPEPATLSLLLFGGLGLLARRRRR